MSRYQALRERLEHAVLHAPATLSPSTRQAAAAGVGVPDNVATLVRKVHQHAYRITDEDIAAAMASGYTEDHIFELVVSAAVGASGQRLDAGMAALRAAKARRS